MAIIGNIPYFQTNPYITWLWCLAQKLLRRFWHWHIFGTEFPWKSGLRPWHAREVDGGLTTLATTGRWCVIQRWICAWLIIDVLKKKTRLDMLRLHLNGRERYASQLLNQRFSSMELYQYQIPAITIYEILPSRLEGALQKELRSRSNGYLGIFKHDWPATCWELKEPLQEPSFSPHPQKL